MRIGSHKKIEEKNGAQAEGQASAELPVRGRKKGQCGQCIVSG